MKNPFSPYIARIVCQQRKWRVKPFVVVRLLWKVAKCVIEGGESRVRYNFLFRMRERG